ncbi:MAG: hypothetical protein GY772_19185, partial [bacterium]|nr:hypothetical protein [bacterium]
GWAFSDATGATSYGPLPGPVQTVNRAELFAAIHCAKVHFRHLDIYSDSAYVVQGAASAAAGDLPRSHRDLWQEFIALPHPPLLWKLTAHLSVAEAAACGLPEAARQGNARADRFARYGAEAHACPAALAAERDTLLALAARVQGAQWQILQAILRAERPFRQRRLRAAPRRHALRGQVRQQHFGAHLVVPSGT